MATAAQEHLARDESGLPLAARIIRARDIAGDDHFGLLEDEEGTLLRRVARDGRGVLAPTQTLVKISEVLAPIEPQNIYGIGLNYRSHAEETGMELPRRPVTFLKATSSVTGHLTDIIIPKSCQAKEEVDFEGELAVVIGKPAKNVSVDDALSHVLGVTVANDVSARRWQGKKGGGQWSRAKSFDTFTPLGPCIVPLRHLGDGTPGAIQDLRLVTRLNGEVMQDSSTADMAFTVAELVSELSQGSTLLPGTVILTGTPDGVGYTRSPPRFLRHGDVVEVEVEGVGKLVNRVRNEGSREEEEEEEQEEEEEVQDA